MASGIEIHPELVAFRFSGLHGVLDRAQRQQLRLDVVDIVDGYVEVELLRTIARRPGRRAESPGLV